MFMFVFCMIVDFMSSFVVSEVVAGDHRSCYILNTVRTTELIDSWLDQTRYSLVMIPTGNKERDEDCDTQSPNGQRYSQLGLLTVSYLT